MRYRGIIFDLDGVICSTDEYHYLAWKSLAESLGISDFTREDNAKQRGVSRMESLEIVLAKSSRCFSESEKAMLADQKNAFYRKMLASMSPADLDPDVRDTLVALRAQGIRIAIGSSSKNASLILQKLGLEDSFDSVVSGNDILHSKPDPEVFLLAAHRLHLAPRECLVVEDAESGIRAGKAGGFDVAAIGEGAKCCNADFVISNLSDLLCRIQ